MYCGHTVGVVVPAYNEEDRIGTVLSTMPDLVDRIYVVDDCSTDGTWDVVRARAAADRGEASEIDVVDDLPELENAVVAAPSDLEGAAPNAAPGGSAEPGRADAGDRASVTDGGVPTRSRIVPIRHRENRGAGGALRTGYRYAYADGTDVVVAMDADGQMDPDQLPRLLDPIVDGIADYAKGNRLATIDDWRGMPPFRLVGNWLLTVLTKVSSGYWRLQDPQNGYTAISREALGAIDLAELPDDHDYTNDVLVRLNVAEMRVADVPMPAVYGDEESTIEYRTFVPTTSATLLRGFLWRLHSRYVADGSYAVPACYALGTAAAVGAAVAGLASLAGAAGGSGVDLETVGSALLLSVAFFLGATGLDARENRSAEVSY